MATWTDIPDSSLEPGKPARSIDALALRDNPIAIAEGAPGAPRIVTAAMNPNSINADRLLNSTITGAKFNDASVQSWLGSRAIGGVGTYMLGSSGSGLSISPGDIVSGGDLRYANAAGDMGGSNPSGSWRCMGYKNTDSPSGRVTLWLRVS